MKLPPFKLERYFAQFEFNVRYNLCASDCESMPIRKRLRLSLKFTWDKDKAEFNIRKHGITFEEASTVFTDPLSVTIDDPLHSYGEERFVIIGESFKERLLVVVHTDIGDTIKIISARPAIKKERKNYESENF